jgi:signal transduction histidine kinase
MLTSSQGLVIEAEGQEEAVEGLVDYLKANPTPKAMENGIEVISLPPVGYTSFVVEVSGDGKADKDEARQGLRAHQEEGNQWEATAPDAVSQRTRDLIALLDIAIALPATTDLDGLLRTIIAKSLQPFEAADAGILFLYEPEEGCLIPRASIGYKQEPLARVRLRPGEALAGKSFQRREPLVCVNAEAIALNVQSLRPANRGHLEEARSGLGQPQSVICVPLISGDSALGALLLVNLRHRGAFSPDDQELLQAIANQVAIVVENARLWAETSRVQALEEANRLKDEFLSGVSHQLLTPITSIKAAADLLSASASDEAEDSKVSLIRTITRNTQRLRGLVNELLELARLRSGIMTLYRQSWDLRAIVRECATAIRPLAEEKEQTLTLALPPSPCNISGDRVRLEQVVINLLSNACKFTPSMGTITVGLEEQDREFVASVSDNGPGIAPAEQERIFERFYSRPIPPRQRAGTGLGLSIAKALVEVHGGRIWVDSTKGQGSTFFFSVPKENEHEGADS